MEFGIVTCCYCYSYNPITDLLEFFIFSAVVGSPVAFFWFGRIIYRWNDPWFEGRGITRIEFPLPSMLPEIVQLIPVAMMVGNCSEAKRCAYCHEEFNTGSARRFCHACGSVTHEECAEISDGCSVFGCPKRKG